MLSLLFSTLAMMGLTFAIGFFVAGVIKIIANWADLFDFYHTHRAELQHIKQMQKLKPVHSTTANETGSYQDTHMKLIHRLNETIGGLKPRRRITA